MLAEKYKPKDLREIVGQKDLILKIDEWLKKWKPGKALLIYGPTGTGKSLIINLVAKERNFSLFELNSSDERSASYIKEKILPAAKEGSLFKKRLILIDEVDSFGQADRGGITEIINVIKQSATPIILIASDAYDSKLRTLRNYCELYKVRRIPKNLIEKKLLEIASKEKLKIDAETIKRIASSADGDIRSAINDMVYSTISIERDKEENIFEVLNTVFKGKSFIRALHAIDSSDKDLEELFWWIEQNIPLEYSSPELIAKAFSILSKADVFRSKVIKNQNYRFNKYMKEMMASISLIENPQRKFVLYRPPQRFITLGSTKISRKDTEEFYKSLGLNCSLRKIKDQAPFLKLILGKKFMGY
jgi:replication factor C large subunit